MLVDWPDDELEEDDGEEALDDELDEELGEEEGLDEELDDELDEELDDELEEDWVGGVTQPAVFSISIISSAKTGTR